MTSTVGDAPRSAPPRATHAGLAVLSLAMGGFAIGTTEFVTMGLLPQIAEGVDVSIPAAGQLISAYALGVVAGVPVLAVFGARLPRRALLVALMAAYALFNVLTAVASSYHLVLVSRFLDGLPHGAYFGVASLVAAGLAPPGKTGRWVASVMLGLSFANVLGVPAATWLGQQAGWRTAFAATAVISTVTVAMILAFVPSMPGNRETTGRHQLSSFMRNGQAWLTLLAGAVGFGGLFAAFSYIAPVVTDVGGLGEGTVPLFVLAFGLGMVVGTWLAGELAGWSVFRSLIGSGIGTAVVLVVFWAVAPFGWWLLPVVFSISALGSVMVVNLQLRLMDVSGDSATLGASMNHAALNLANALGAWIGGLTIAAGYGYRSPALAGVGLSLLGIAVLLWSATLHRRDAVTSEASTS